MLCVAEAQTLTINPQHDSNNFGIEQSNLPLPTRSLLVSYSPRQHPLHWNGVWSNISHDFCIWWLGVRHVIIYVQGMAEVLSAFSADGVERRGSSVILLTSSVCIFGRKIG